MEVLRATAPTSLVSFVSPKIKAKPTNFNLQTKVFLRTPLQTYNLIRSSSFRPLPPSNSFLNRHQISPSDLNFQIFLPSLNLIKPYVQAEWRSILKGWACSVISVLCLSKVVPKVGKFSSVLSSIDANRFAKEGLVLGVLVLVRLVANYWQQAFLWDAALNSAYKIRVYVFEKVLQRDLGFFEGSGGVSAGDVSHRITAEASDVADTVYALLSTVIPSTLQLSAMATHMLVFSPVLSLVSALDVGKAYNELKQGEPAIERLFDLTSFNLQVMEKPDAIDLDSVTGDVKFCGISFRYGDNMPLVLNELDLHIKPGETIALVGPSGGGKTTLTKLLLRLYEPLSGCILVDNHDIQNIRLESLKRHVGLVSQDITLFSGTVAENIGYRDFMSKINMERVENAARTANADGFIKELPNGYETNIGPRGSLLSGGQKQRLAIARALYQNSSILILDEATSALDSKSEVLVRQAVEHLMKNHTVLVIAHRLETVLMAKRVFLLENGRLEEISHSSLVAKRGHYGVTSV